MRAVSASLSASYLKTKSLPDQRADTVSASRGSLIVSFAMSFAGLCAGSVPREETPQSG
jgi:hypothetical protein